MSNEKEYEVSFVVAERKGDDGEVEYRLRWKGYSISVDTWQAEAPDELVSEFRKRSSYCVAQLTELETILERIEMWRQHKRHTKTKWEKQLAAEKDSTVKRGLIALRDAEDKIVLELDKSAKRQEEFLVTQSMNPANIDADEKENAEQRVQAIYQLRAECLRSLDTASNEMAEITAAAEASANAKRGSKKSGAAAAQSKDKAAPSAKSKVKTDPTSVATAATVAVEEKKVTPAKKTPPAKPVHQARKVAPSSTTPPTRTSTIDFSDDDDDDEPLAEMATSSSRRPVPAKKVKEESKRAEKIDAGTPPISPANAFIPFKTLPTFSSSPITVSSSSPVIVSPEPAIISSNVSPLQTAASTTIQRRPSTPAPARSKSVSVEIVGEDVFQLRPAMTVSTARANAQSNSIRIPFRSPTSGSTDVPAVAVAEEGTRTVKQSPIASSITTSAPIASKAAEPTKSTAAHLLKPAIIDMELDTDSPTSVSISSPVLLANASAPLTVTSVAMSISFPATADTNTNTNTDMDYVLEMPAMSKKPNESSAPMELVEAKKKRPLLSIAESEQLAKKPKLDSAPVSTTPTTSSSAGSKPSGSVSKAPQGKKEIKRTFSSSSDNDSNSDSDSDLEPDPDSGSGDSSSSCSSTESEEDAVEVDGEEAFVVSRLLAERRNRETDDIEFEVKWRGYKETTWEPIENILDRSLITRFRKKAAKKRRKLFKQKRTEHNIKGDERRKKRKAEKENMRKEKDESKKTKLPDKKEKTVKKGHVQSSSAGAASSSAALTPEEIRKKEEYRARRLKELLEQQRAAKDYSARVEHSREEEKAVKVRLGDKDVRAPSSKIGPKPLISPSKRPLSPTTQRAQEMSRVALPGGVVPTALHFATAASTAGTMKMIMPNAIASAPRSAFATGKDLTRKPIPLLTLTFQRNISTDSNISQGSAASAIGRAGASLPNMITFNDMDLSFASHLSNPADHTSPHSRQYAHIQDMSPRQELVSPRFSNSPAAAADPLSIYSPHVVSPLQPILPPSPVAIRRRRMLFIGDDQLLLAKWVMQNFDASSPMQLLLAGININELHEFHFVTPLSQDQITDRSISQLLQSKSLTFHVKWKLGELGSLSSWFPSRKKMNEPAYFDAVLTLLSPFAPSTPIPASTAPAALNPSTLVKQMYVDIKTGLMDVEKWKQFFVAKLLPAISSLIDPPLIPLPHTEVVHPKVKVVTVYQQQQILNQTLIQSLAQEGKCSFVNRELVREGPIMLGVLPMRNQFTDDCQVELFTFERGINKQITPTKSAQPITVAPSSPRSRGMQASRVSQHSFGSHLPSMDAVSLGVVEDDDFNRMIEADFDDDDVMYTGGNVGASTNDTKDRKLFSSSVKKQETGSSGPSAISILTAKDVAAKNAQLTELNNAKLALSILGETHVYEHKLTVDDLTEAVIVTIDDDSSASKSDSKRAMSDDLGDFTDVLRIDPSTLVGSAVGDYNVEEASQSLQSEFNKLSLMQQWKKWFKGEKLSYNSDLACESLLGPDLSQHSLLCGGCLVPSCTAHRPHRLSHHVTPILVGTKANGWSCRHEPIHVGGIKRFECQMMELPTAAVLPYTCAAGLFSDCIPQHEASFDLPLPPCDAQDLEKAHPPGCEWPTMKMSSKVSQALPPPITIAPPVETLQPPPVSSPAHHTVPSSVTTAATSSTLEQKYPQPPPAVAPTHSGTVHPDRVKLVPNASSSARAAGSGGRSSAPEDDRHRSREYDREFDRQYRDRDRDHDRDRDWDRDRDRGHGRDRDRGWSRDQYPSERDAHTRRIREVRLREDIERDRDRDRNRDRDYSTRSPTNGQPRHPSPATSHSQSSNRHPPTSYPSVRRHSEHFQPIPTIDETK